MVDKGIYRELVEQRLDSPGRGKDPRPFGLTGSNIVRNEMHGPADRG